MKIFETRGSFLKKKNLRVVLSRLFVFFSSEFISRASIGKREIKSFLFFFCRDKMKRAGSFHRVIGGILIWIILSLKKLCVSLYSTFLSPRMENFVD